MWWTFVVFRRCLQKNTNTTAWRHGDSGLQDGPWCFLVFSWPRALSTHWVGWCWWCCKAISCITSYFSAFSTHSLSSACSGLGSYPQRARVCRPEDLRPVHLLLAITSCDRRRLAFLPTTSGDSSGRTGSASTLSGPLRISTQEKWLTSWLVLKVKVVYLNKQSSVDNSFTPAIQVVSKNNLTQVEDFCHLPMFSNVAWQNFVQACTSCVFSCFSSS